MEIESSEKIEVAQASGELFAGAVLVGVGALLSYIIIKGIFFPSGLGKKD